MKTALAFVTIASLFVASAFAGDGVDGVRECSEPEIQTVLTDLEAEIADCKAKTDYDMSRLRTPTNEEKELICDCKELIDKLPTYELPACWINFKPNDYTFLQAVTASFKLCEHDEFVEAAPVDAAPVEAASGSGSVTDEITPAVFCSMGESSTTDGCGGKATETEVTPAGSSSGSSGNGTESMPASSEPVPSPSPSSAASSIAVGAAAAAVGVVAVIMA